MPQEIRVPPGIEAIRLDRFACENFESLSSRNQARKAIKREELLLNGEVAESSRFVREETRSVSKNGRHPSTKFSNSLCPFTTRTSTLLL